MGIYTFDVKEAVRDGYIAYDAVDRSTRTIIALGEQSKAGEYPVIDIYLAHRCAGIHGVLVYTKSFGDEFDQKAQRWVFRRGEDTVIVNDVVRTVFVVGSAMTG